MTKALVALCSIAAVGCAHVATPRAAVARANERTDVWPGFDPATIPVAVFDGRDTWLFAGDGTSRRVPGRHAAVASNSLSEIDHVLYATVPRLPSSLAEAAALIAHEKFHVYQAKHHPDWSANEASYFAYPTLDADVATAAALEQLALGRALAAARPDDALGWAAAARAQRRERFARLGAALVGYERMTELHEGLAAYVQRRTAGRPRPEPCAPGVDPRRRAYCTGDALATLLDRLTPAWKATLTHATAPLDELLPAAAPYAFSADDRLSARQLAEREIADERGRKQALAARFERRGGHVLRIVASAARPLWPQDFDPLNVTQIDGKHVLHQRHLKVGNERGSVEIFGEAMTEDAGPQPLMTGLRELVVKGLPAPPAIAHGEIRAAGVSGAFTDAVVESHANETIVRLP